MNKRIVVSFGRFNPPTTGHDVVMSFVATTAIRLQADALVIPSPTQDPKRNPLPYAEKVAFLRKLWPRLAFSDDARVRTPFDALRMLAERGYTEVYVVVGSDRVAEFTRFGQYVMPLRKTQRQQKSRTAALERIAAKVKKNEPVAPDDERAAQRGIVEPKGIAPKDIIWLDKYHVVPVPADRDADAEDTRSMSGTKVREYAVAGDFAAFQAGVPTRNRALATQLYQSVRTHMGVKTDKLNESNIVFMTYGVTPTANRPLRQAMMRTTAARTLPSFMCADVTGYSFPTIRRLHEEFVTRGYRPVLYVRTHMVALTEHTMRAQSTLGMIREQLARDVVEVVGTDDEARSAVETHMRQRLAEAEGAPKPKEPSEVDRLKVQQKQDALALKQRQNNDILQAKQRELQKKSREDSQKIINGAKPKAITR